MGARTCRTLFLAVCVLTGAGAASNPPAPDIQLASRPAMTAVQVSQRLEELAKSQQDRELAYQLGVAAKNPSSPYPFESAVEHAYNLGNRPMAMEILDLAEQSVSPEGQRKILAVRRAIWRHELDLDSLEASYVAELDAAIGRQDQYLPDLQLDSVMLRRVLPRYL